MRWVWLVLGLILVLLGAVWTLQGVGLLGGSAMTGDRTWAVVGPIVVLLGVAIAIVAARHRHRSPPKHR